MSIMEGYNEFFTDFFTSLPDFFLQSKFTFTSTFCFVTSPI